MLIIARNHDAKEAINWSGKPLSTVFASLDGVRPGLEMRRKKSKSPLDPYLWNFKGPDFSPKFESTSQSQYFKQEIYPIISNSNQVSVFLLHLV